MELIIGTLTLENLLQAKYKTHFLINSIKPLTKNTQDTAKLNHLHRDNTMIEIQSISLCVNSRLASLNSQNQSLAIHVKTITKKQYITFDPADKPDSIISYFDKVYFLGLDLIILLSDGVKLYNE